MAFDLVTIRNITRLQAAANGSDSSLYTPFNTDLAAVSAINEFCNDTKYSKRTDAVVLASGTAVLPAMPTNFTAGRLLKAYMISANVQTWNGVVGIWFSYLNQSAPDLTWGGVLSYSAELEVVDIAQLINARQAYQPGFNNSTANNTAAQPGWIAFDGTNTGYIYPAVPSPYTATPTMSGTFPTKDLASVAVTNGGAGIYSAPATIVQDGFGGSATLTFTLSAGVVTGIAVSGSNSQWKVAPNVNVAPVLTAPQQNFTLTLLWWEPMQTFTPGTQGAWVSGQAYYVNDVVSNSGTLWRCVTPNASGAPAAPNWVSLGAGTATEPTNITAPAALTDDVLMEVLTIGTPCFMMFNRPELLLNAQAQFKALKAKYQRMADHGVRGYTRTPARAGFARSY